MHDWFIHFIIIFLINPYLMNLIFVLVNFITYFSLEILVQTNQLSKTYPHVQCCVMTFLVS